MTSPFKSRTASWLRSVFILFASAWIGVAVQAGAQEPTLNVGISTAKPGDPVDIPLTISGAEQPQRAWRDAVRPTDRQLARTPFLLIALRQK